MYRRVLAFRQLVRERSVAKIHAVSAIPSECRRQERRIHVAERNTVGHTEAAVDGHAHDGGACSAHVDRKANNVAYSPRAAVSSLTGFVPLEQTNTICSPRPHVIAYALTAGVFSRSPANLERARRDLEAGNVYLNRGITGALVARQPFGGYRMSGIGSKAGGPDYLLQFTVPRTVTENTLRRGFAPTRPSGDGRRHG
jgi:hypothetical protein